MPPVASFTTDVNQRLVKCPLKSNGRFANDGLTSVVKDATREILKIQEYRQYNASALSMIKS